MKRLWKKQTFPSMTFLLVITDEKSHSLLIWRAPWHFLLLLVRAVFFSSFHRRGTGTKTCYEMWARPGAHVALNLQWEAQASVLALSIRPLSRLHFHPHCSVKLKPTLPTSPASACPHIAALVTSVPEIGRNAWDRSLGFPVTLLQASWAGYGSFHPC